jgi:hypothetical protein
MKRADISGRLQACCRRDYRESHAKKRTVGEADCRHAVGEAGKRHAMKRADRSGRLKACCRRGQGEACHEEG